VERFIVIQTGPDVWAVAQRVRQPEMDEFLVCYSRIRSQGAAQAIRRLLIDKKPIPTEWQKHKVNWL